MRLLLALTTLVIAVPASLPGTQSRRACAGAGPYWPTETLALRAGTAWVACKEQQRVVRVSLPSGAVRSTALGGAPIAVLSDLGAVWALDASGVISRLDPASGKVTASIDTGAGKPYNLWAGAGSLWTVDDSTGEIVRIEETAPISKLKTWRVLSRADEAAADARADEKAEAKAKGRKAKADADVAPEPAEA